MAGNPLAALPWLAAWEPFPLTGCLLAGIVLRPSPLCSAPPLTAMCQVATSPWALHVPPAQRSI